MTTYSRRTDSVNKRRCLRRKVTDLVLLRFQKVGKIANAPTSDPGGHAMHKQYVTRPDRYVQACEDWRHYDAQYGQFFVAYVVQSLGFLAAIFSERMLNTTDAEKRAITIGVFVFLVLFLIIFVRLRLALNGFQKEIHTHLGKRLKRTIGEELWRTSTWMILFMIIASSSSIALVWTGKYLAAR